MAKTTNDAGWYEIEAHTDLGWAVVGDPLIVHGGVAENRARRYESLEKAMAAAEPVDGTVRVVHVVPAKDSYAEPSRSAVWARGK